MRPKTEKETAREVARALADAHQEAHEAQREAARDAVVIANATVGRPGGSKPPVAGEREAP